MDCVELVGRAAAAFADGADASFLACFADDAAVYMHPGRAASPVADLEGLVAQARHRYPDLTVQVCDITAHASGALCDAIIESGGAAADVWRFVLAIDCDATQIRELRPFWQRDAAAKWLLENQ